MDRSIESRFNVEEYKTLRAEQIQRIMLMNSQTSGLTTVIISTWGPVITIFISVLTALFQDKIDMTNYDIRSIFSIVLLIQSVFLTCATLLMYPLSIKGRENLRQIIAIGAYIQTFYESVPLMRGEEIFHWDGFHSDLNPLLSNKQINLKDKMKNFFQSNMARHYNDEIVVLVLMSSIGACTTIIAAYITGIGKFESYFFWLLIGYICFIVYKTLRICKIANTKHFIEQESCEYRLHYLEKAKELNIVTDDEFRKLKEKLDFDVSIAELKWWTIKKHDR